MSAEGNDFSFAAIENLRRGTADLKRVLAELNGLAPKPVPASHAKGQASEQYSSAKRDACPEVRGCGGQRGAGTGRG
jgi:hypothetical protein